LKEIAFPGEKKGRLQRDKTVQEVHWAGTAINEPTRKHPASKKDLPEAPTSLQSTSLSSAGG